MHEQSGIKLSQPVPILRILDEAKAREFYVEFLGFSIDWEHRFEANAPLYMQISRDGCVIHLSEHYGDCTPGGALRIDTNDVEGLNRELLQKQYKFARPGVSDTPWQTLEMNIKDPSAIAWCSASASDRDRNRRRRPDVCFGA